MTKTEICQKLKYYRITSALMIVLGVVLMIYMIMVEDEPGALPLLIIITGIVWYVQNQLKIIKHNK